MVTVSEIQKILNDAGISGEVEQGLIPQLIAVTIYWGDWKHDHGYLKYLMQQQGLTHVKEELLEEDEETVATIDETINKILKLGDFIAKNKI